MNILNGKLSYILAAVAILGGGAGFLLGIIDGEQATQMIYGGLALFGIRRAIDKI